MVLVISIEKIVFALMKRLVTQIKTKRITAVVEVTNILHRNSIRKDSGMVFNKGCKGEGKHSKEDQIGKDFTTG